MNRRKKRHLSTHLCIGNRQNPSHARKPVAIDLYTTLYFNQVSIVAASSCRYVYWQRTSLEYLFVKEPYLANVVTTLIARDITTKLYAMNNKIVTERGSHLDIRLPSISHALAKSPRKLRSTARLPPPTTVQPVPPMKKPSELHTRHFF